MHQKPKFFIKIILALLFVTPNFAYCKYSGPMRFSVFHPCSGSASFCGARILAEGVIGADTANKFRSFLDNKDNYKEPYYLSPKPTVCFDSPGGDLGGAITLGTTIRERGLDTCLKSEYTSEYETVLKGAICASACVFALAGGVNRELLGEEAKVGVHQFSGSSKPIGDSSTQLTMVALAAYFEKMGVSRNLLDIGSLFPPNKLYWLSEEEIQLVKLDNISIELKEWRLDTTDEGSVFAYVIQHKPGTHSQVALYIIKDKMVPRLEIYFEPLNPTSERLENAKKALKYNRYVILTIDDKNIAKYKSPVWHQVRYKALATSLMLSKQTVQHLRRGKKLKILVDVANVDKEYDPSLEFQLKGLSRLMSAVLN